LPADIICQKVATEGLTRFEDRNRLPLGISVNLNSFSAKTLAQVRHSVAAAVLRVCWLWLLHGPKHRSMDCSSCLAPGFWQHMQ
jgi:hypothetical protein